MTMGWWRRSLARSLLPSADNIDALCLAQRLLVLQCAAHASLHWALVLACEYGPLPLPALPYSYSLRVAFLGQCPRLRF